MVTNGNEKGSKLGSAVGNLLKSPAIFRDHKFSQCGQEQNVISWEIDYFIKTFKNIQKTFKKMFNTLGCKLMHATAGLRSTPPTQRERAPD
jgi:hypothetical protein